MISDGRGHAAQQRGHFRTSLGKPEDVVDEEQHVLIFLVPEKLGNGQTSQGHTQTSSRGFVHLPIDQCCFGLREIVRVDNLRLLHFVPEIVPFTSPLTDAGEHGESAVVQGDVIDELHDDDGFADAGSAEQTDLPTFTIRLEQVHNLDARF